MRDLYNRKQKLQYWIQKVKTELDEPDKADVLKFVEHMQENDKSILWIVRCITALIYIRRQLNKSFGDCKKEDIKSLFAWMDAKGYKASTHEKFRKILKIFYKVIYGQNESHPPQVSWFSTQVGKERKSQERDLDIAEYLEENEVPLLIDAAPTVQKKALLACMYESGARPEEFLRLTNLDIKLDVNGAILFLRGKTGERRVRIVCFAKLLQQWLDIHPLKNQYQYPIWISQATNYNNNPLGLRGAQKIIEEVLSKANLNKHKRLYLLRHSRATHLCKHLTEAQMCVFFGWTIGTKVVRRYIHLSGKDLDNTLLSIGQYKQLQQQEYQLKIRKCNRCSEDLSPTQQFCSRCGLTTKFSEQYSKETNLEKENNELKIHIKSLRDEMNQKFEQLLVLIQNNPKLSLIKPNILVEGLNKFQNDK
jgi:site-specific recombinase XerD